MLISHEHRFVFIKTRKTAGTSIEVGLAPHLGEDDVITELNEEAEALRAEVGGRSPRNEDVPPHRWRVRDWPKAALGRRPCFSPHTPAYVVRRYLPARQWDDYLTVTLDRNPWDLAVSAHRWFQKRTGRSMTFREFVLSEELEGYSNWRLYADGDTVLVDEVHRYDELDGLLAMLGDRMGLSAPPTLPRAKGGLRSTRSYTEDYDAETRERVAQVFHREVDAFGWTYEG